MGLPWRRGGRKGRRQDKRDISGENSDLELKVPSHFRCPISLELMRDPVTLSTGITYDRQNIERWFEADNERCPVTNRTLKPTDRTILIPNHTMRRMIQDWCVDNRSFGIERIPTPRVPLTPEDVSEICRKMEDAVRSGDEGLCSEIVREIKDLGKESERNKICLGQNGVVSVMSLCLDRFARVSMEKHVRILEEVLSVVAWVLPDGVEGLPKMASAVSLRCMVWFLNNGNLMGMQNAAFCLKELLSLDLTYVVALMEIDGACEGLVKLIKNPSCPDSTKSSLMVIYHMIWFAKPENEIVSRFVQMGLVSLIVEMILNSEKSICEKALVVLDAICESQEGIEDVSRNALIIPLLVKKILRISDLATRCSVSILWKLWKKDEKNGESVLVECFQVGAFEKLLVVLQVGCEDETKEKVSELLRILNHHRAKIEVNCVHTSMNLKYVKRSF